MGEITKPGETPWKRIVEPMPETTPVHEPSPQVPVPEPVR